MEFTSIGTEYVDKFFAHHGIKGQKWGIRRFQNEDGTLTELGRKRYNKIVENYKNDKGEFSARKSTKASVLTAFSGGATGLGLTLAGLPMVGLPVAAASQAAATIGAIKRERARRFLENTGTGDIKDISLDRRYATNFDILGLGALINTAYGTHREKVAERVKNDLANTKMSDIKKDATKTKGKANVTDAKEVEKEKTEKKESYRKKQLSHSDSSDITFNDILAAGEAIEHSGIKGQKWGLRRFQYNDGSLTPEGRKRYLKGGDRAVRKAEKQRAKREAILSDRKKLFKHRDEFTKAEIDKAMEKFISEDRLKAKMDEDKAAKRQAKIESQNAKAALKQAKADYKKMQMQLKLNKQAEDLKRETQRLQAKEAQKQAELKTKSDKLALQSKRETADASANAEKWKKRVEKTRSILDFAKAGKEILDDMGITSKDGSESLLGSLAEAMGIKDTSAKKAAADAKKARELMKEKAAAASALKEFYSSKNTAYSGLTKDQMDEILRKAGLADFIV